MKGMNAQLGGMMKQVQELRRKIAQAHEDLRTRVVEGSSGGGMVTAQMNGKQELVALKIDPQVVDPNDVRMLEDLILAAVSQATKKSLELYETEVNKIRGGLDLPPGMF